jgi:NTP pyrophosphatase (non-canonical NTP hydrolase)
MKNHVDFGAYEKFVDTVTSEESTSFLALSDRLVELDEKGANIERLLTAAVGISAEGGEFMEIVKKMIFQGKPYDKSNKEHLIIELGDVMWYVAQACMALGVSMDEVVETNVKKLAKRYPEGTFDEFFSENRKAGDR